MKKLIIVRGLPGSGKTTFVKDLGPHLHMESYDMSDSTHCCADHFMIDNEGKYQFDPSRLREVHNRCQEKARIAMSQGCHLVFVSNTSTQDWEIKPYYELAQKYDYRVHSIIIENRHNGTTIHGVPENKIQVMKERFEVKL